MNDFDKNNFKQLMTLIGENYNSEFSIVKIKLWWDLLKSYEYQDLHNAVYKHMLESSFAPKPSRPD